MRAILRGYDGLIVGLAVLGGVAYALVTLGIIADVVLRNTGFRPFRATSALVEYAILFATMAAGPWLVRQGGHVAVDSFVALMPDGLRRAVGVAVMLLTIAVLLLLCWRSGLNAMDEIAFGGVDMRSINIPGWVPYGLLAGGFGLMATEVLRLLLRRATTIGGTQSH